MELLRPNGLRRPHRLRNRRLRRRLSVLKEPVLRRLRTQQLFGDLVVSRVMLGGNSIGFFQSEKMAPIWAQN